MQQLELEKALKARSAQMDDQPVDPQEEIERLRIAQNELAAKKEALRRIEERRESIVGARKDALYRLKRSLEELEKEQGYMKDELNDLEQIKECFIRHARDIEYLDPEEWDRNHMDSYMEKTEKVLEQIEVDYMEAIEHCIKRMSRTKMFADQKVGKRSFLGANLTDVFFQGLVYNLALILLGFTALIVYIFKS